MRQRQFALVPFHERRSTVLWTTVDVPVELTDDQAAALWSISGSTLALLTWDDANERCSIKFVDTTARSHSVSLQSCRALTSAYWSPDGSLFVRLRNSSRVGKCKCGSSQASAWIAVDRSSSAPAVLLSSATDDSLPSRLFPIPGESQLLALRSGQLYTIDRTGKVRVLRLFSDTIDYRVSAISTANDTEGVFVVTTSSREHRSKYFLLSTSERKMRTKLITTPFEDAFLLGVNVRANRTYFAREAPSGELSISAGEITSSLYASVLNLNEQLVDVTVGNQLLFRYMSTDGDSLTGALLLPIGYVPSHRYPLITWVYPGTIVSHRPLPTFAKAQRSPFNLNLLSAMGYAVLVPSMPLPNDTLGTDALFEVSKGVFPAINRVIELGVADPNRLGLMGHSFGGYSVDALVALSNRFKAAVSASGPSDLISMYGTLSGQNRYTNGGYRDVYGPSLLEGGQINLQTPMTDDVFRYARNSPVLLANKINTPLLLLHGGRDYVDMSQGEELFMNLYRFGKRARLVRYWDEGHRFDRFSDICNMWEEILEWFNRYLPGDAAPTGSSSRVCSDTTITPAVPQLRATAEPVR